MSEKNEIAIKKGNKRDLTKLYRPKKLSQVVGQETATRVLQSSINKLEAMSCILLSGASGSGKTTIARMVAQYYNCNHLKKNENGDYEPCGECKSCLLFKKDFDSHPDVREYNAANATSIEDVRTWIRGTSFMPTFRRKVLIIDECHRLSVQAKDALLKPTEDCPPHVTFIFCTTEPEKLPPALRNRCTNLKINNVTQDDCAKLIFRVSKKEGKELDKSICKKIAALVDCCPRPALHALSCVLDSLHGKKDIKMEDLELMVEQTISLPPYKVVNEILINLYKGKVASAIKAMQKTQDQVVLAKMLVDAHYKMCVFKMGEPTLLSQIWYDKILYKEVGPLVLPQPLMTYTLKELIKTNTQVREFETSASMLLGIAFMTICDCINQNKKSKE